MEVERGAPKPCSWSRSTEERCGNLKQALVSFDEAIAAARAVGDESNLHVSLVNVTGRGCGQVISMAPSGSASRRLRRLSA